MLHTVSWPAEAALPPAPARSPLRFTRCRAWWARWLLALAIWCVAASVRWLLDDIVISGPFLTFLPAIALTTVFCGRQPAVAVIVGLLLQIPLPQAPTHAVAAATIRGNQQSRRGGIAGPACRSSCVTRSRPDAAIDGIIDHDLQRIVDDGDDQQSAGAPCCAYMSSMSWMSPFGSAGGFADHHVTIVPDLIEAAMNSSKHIAPRAACSPLNCACSTGWH